MSLVLCGACDKVVWELVGQEAARRRGEHRANQEEILHYRDGKESQIFYKVGRFVVRMKEHTILLLSSLDFSQSVRPIIIVGKLERERLLLKGAISFVRYLCITHRKVIFLCENRSIMNMSFSVPYVSIWPFVLLSSVSSPKSHILRL